MDGKPSAEWKYDAAVPGPDGLSTRELVSAWDAAGSRTVTSGKGVLKSRRLLAGGCIASIGQEYKGGNPVEAPVIKEDCSTTSEFPSIEYSYVKVFRQGDSFLAWDADYDQSWAYSQIKGVNSHDYYLEGLMHPQFRGQGHTLSKVQATSLVKTLNNEASFEESMGGSKGDPTLLFVFYDGDHVPVAFFGLNMNLQKGVSSPILTSLDVAKNTVFSPAGYNAFAKLCFELWQGEDGLCDPLGFLPAEKKPDDK